MRFVALLWLSFTVTFFATGTEANLSSDICRKKVIRDYMEIYNQRDDIEALMSLYHEDIQLIDVNNGDNITGKQKLKAFFNWQSPNHVKLTENNLIVHKIWSSNETVLVDGIFQPFMWGDFKFPEMRFQMRFKFSDDNKIIYQEDEIAYPDLQGL